MRNAEHANNRDELSGNKPVTERLHEIFRRRAREFPDRIAVSDETQQLTYAELDTLSSQLSVTLREQGVRSETLVGLYMERGVELLTCLLAILKAGGAYLPIDPTYPVNRIEYMLADSRVSIVACTSKNSSALPQSVRKLLIDESWRGLDPQAPDADFHVGEQAAYAADLAYVIYTSGSTGKPKGVMIQHDNVVRLLQQTHHWFGFNAFDVWSMFHSIGFDFSVWEIWGALLFGAQVAVVPYAVSRSPASFHEWLARIRVSVLNLTPSAFLALDRIDQDAARPLSLRYIIFGGEVLRPAMLTRWIERHGDDTPSLVNMYGLTETTVHVTYRRMTRHDVSTTENPIGVPIPDLSMLLLDDTQSPVPDGTPGEMYIAGPGVARGYLNQPELTAARFVQLHVGGAGGPVRAYKTGDIAIRRANGEFAYVGRADRQLKVRGFRIEPGEVERCLLGDPSVSACHVCSHDYCDGDVRLVAYIVPSRDVARWASQEAAVRRRAAAALPDYMRPSSYVALPMLPLTAHGKIDHNALPSPEPDVRSPSLERSDEAPLSEEQAWVLQVWRDQLGLKGIGLEDDFFDFGGTSLALIRAIAAIKSRYQINLDPGVLAERATASALADVIRDRRQ